MNKKNASSKEISKSRKPESSLRNSSNGKNTNAAVPNEEVLLKVGSLEYKTPSRRQRIIIGSIVLGLNLLLVIASLAYFKIPAFQEFIYNIGRN